MNNVIYLGKYFFIFGTTADLQPVRICVYKHETYFFVRSPGSKEDLKKPKYRQQKAKEIRSILQDAGVDISKDPVDQEMYQAQYFVKEKDVYLKVFLKDFSQLVFAEKTLRDKQYSIPVRLDDSSKFVFDLGLNHCCWIEIDDEHSTRYDFVKTSSKRKPIQIVTHSKHIKRSNITDVPPPLLTCSFDTEAYSSTYGIDGALSHPNAVNADDVLYSLSMVFSMRKGDMAIKKNILIYKEKIDLDDIENICVEDEQELFMKFAKIMDEEDPDVLTGYNIKSFDFDYMTKRSSCMDIPKYGRLRPFRHPCVNVFNEEGKPEKISITLAIPEEEIYYSKSWEGAGKKFHRFVRPEMHGRIILDCFDLTKHFKVSRGIEGALQSHKLKDVGAFLTKEEKDDLSYKDTYLNFRSGEKEKLAENAKYCVQDSVVNLAVYYVFKPDISLRESANNFFQEINAVQETGSSAKILPTFLIVCEESGFLFHMYKKDNGDGYDGGFVGAPLCGKRSNTATLDFSSMYPSAQMAKNICITTISKLRPDLDPLEYEEFNVEISKGIRELPAMYEDYIDLYDISMIDDKDYLKDFMIENEIEEEYRDTFMNIVRTSNGLPSVAPKENMKVFIVKKEYREGIFPKILFDLKKKRKEYKKQMAIAAENNDMINYDINDQRQQLIKVIMNSIYGILGSANGQLSCVEASAVITHFGRECVKKVGQYLADKGCKIIYGDTDSVMFQIPNYVEKDFDTEVDQEVVDYVNQMTKEINGWLPPPMQVEFEKVMHMIPIKKKHYLGIKVYEDGKKIRKPIIRGLAAVRGDSTPYAQVLFTKFSQMIFENKSSEDVTNFIKEEVDKLMTGKIPNDMLAVSSTLSHSYKSRSSPMAVYADYLRKNNIPADPGTKIPFLITVGNGQKSYRMRPVDTEEKIDYKHYYERAIKSIEIIYERAFDKPLVIA